MDAREKLQAMVDMGVKYPFILMVVGGTQPQLRHYAKGRTETCPVEENKIHKLYDSLMALI